MLPVRCIIRLTPTNRQTDTLTGHSDFNSPDWHFPGIYVVCPLQSLTKKNLILTEMFPGREAAKYVFEDSVMMTQAITYACNFGYLFTQHGLWSISDIQLIRWDGCTQSSYPPISNKFLLFFSYTFQISVYHFQSCNFTQHKRGLT